MIIPDDITEPVIGLKDGFFDLKGLALYSSLGIGTIRDYIRTGRLPAYKVRGKVLVKRSEFDQWMEAYRVNRKQDLNKVVNQVMSELRRPKPDG